LSTPLATTPIVARVRRTPIVRRSRTPRTTNRPTKNANAKKMRARLRPRRRTNEPGRSQGKKMVCSRAFLLMRQPAKLLIEMRGMRMEKAMKARPRRP
jgi:hypothetical protein